MDCLGVIARGRSKMRFTKHIRNGLWRSDAEKDCHDRSVSWLLRSSGEWSLAIIPNCVLGLTACTTSMDCILVT